MFEKNRLRWNQSLFESVPGDLEAETQMELRGIEERGGRYKCFLGLYFGAIDDKWVSP